MGYVPQDDVMLADMTVEELLQFSARVRLPAAARPADHMRHVDRTIKARFLVLSSGSGGEVYKAAAEEGTRRRLVSQTLLLVNYCMKA